MATLVSSQNLNQNILLKNVFESEKSPKETNEDKIKSFLEKVLTREDVTERLLAAMQPTPVKGTEWWKGDHRHGPMWVTKTEEIMPGIYPLKKEDYKVLTHYVSDVMHALSKGDNDKALEELEQKFHGDVTWGVLWWAKDHTSSAGFLLSWIGEACAEKGLPKLGTIIGEIGSKLMGYDSLFHNNLENVKAELNKIREEMRPLQETKEKLEKSGFHLDIPSEEKFYGLEFEERKKVALEKKLEAISETIKEAIGSCSLQDQDQDQDQDLDDESYQWALSALGVPPYEESQEKVGVQTKMRVRLLG